MITEWKAAKNGNNSRPLDRWSQARATTRLIIAGPAMLAALKADIVHVHSSFECGEDGLMCPVFEMKRAAIAKAEGGSK